MDSKLSVWLGFLILILFGIGILTPVKAGPPVMPSSFFGLVRENGENVPDGTNISAWINDVQYVETLSFSYNGSAVYALDIPADDPTTSGIIEGGSEGDTVVFKIGGIVASQLGTWHSGTNQELDLSISYTIMNTFLPLVLR